MGKFQVSTRKAAHACTVSAARSTVAVALNSSAAASVQTLASNAGCPLVAPLPTPSRPPSKAESRMSQLLERVRAKERRGP